MTLFPPSKIFIATAFAGLCLGTLAVAGDENPASNTKEERVETTVKDGIIKIRINDGKEITIPMPAGILGGDAEGDKAVVNKDVHVITLHADGNDDEKSSTIDSDKKKMRVVLRGKAVMVGDDGKTSVIEFEPKDMKQMEEISKHFREGQHGFTWTMRDDDNAAFAHAAAGKFMIGVHPEEVSDVLRAHLPVKEGVGLVVMEVVKGSPAEEAGIEKHDILIKVNDEDVKGIDTLIAQVQKSGEAKEQAKLLVLRRGKEVEIAVSPKEREMGEGMELHTKVLEHLGSVDDAKALAKQLADVAREKAQAAVAVAQAAAGNEELKALAAQVEELKAEIEAIKKELKK